MYSVMRIYELLKLTWGRDLRLGYSREVAMCFGGSHFGGSHFGGSHFGGSAHGRRQKTKAAHGH